MESYIYTLTDPITNYIRYVGKTDYPDKRFKQHLNSKSNLTHKERWIWGLKNKGLLPIFEILDVIDNNEWVYWEQYWICQLRQWGFLLTNIGIGGEGGNCTIETRKKISESKRGTQTRLGSKWTEKQRKIIINKLTGRKQSIDEIKKRTESNFKKIDLSFVISEYDKGFTYKQIADKLNLSESKVYRTLRDNNLIREKRVINYSKYSEVDLPFILSAYQEGLTYKQIAVRLNLSESKIYRVLEENNIINENILKKKTILKEIDNIIILEYQEGLTYKQIADKLNMSKSKVYRTLKSNNMIKTSYK